MNIVKASKSFKTPNIIFVLLMIVRVVMITAVAIENETVVSVCNHTLIGLGMMLYICSILEGAKKLNVIFVAFLGYLLYMFAGINFENGVALLNFILMISTWQSAKSVNISKYVGKAILFTELVQGLILIYIYHTPLAYKPITEYAKASEWLTLGFSNPNQTGIILFSTIAILLMMVKRYTEKRYTRLIVYCEIGYLIFMLLKTGARISIVSMAVIAVTILLGLDKLRLKKHPVLLSAVPVLQLPFCYFYMWLAELYKYSEFKFMDKLFFSGRENLYAMVFDIWSNKAFGNIGFMFANFHNASLTILVNIGIVGFALFIAYILVELNKLYSTCYRGKGIYAMISIVALFIIGYAEAAVLVSGSFYYISLLVFVVMAYNSSGEECDIQKTENERM